LKKIQVGNFSKGAIQLISKDKIGRFYAMYIYVRLKVNAH
jgi:hypothetical protein